MLVKFIDSDGEVIGVQPKKVECVLAFDDDDKQKHCVISFLADSDNNILVRGTVDEVVDKLNGVEAGMPSRRLVENVEAKAELLERRSLLSQYSKLADTVDEIRKDIDLLAGRVEKVDNRTIKHEVIGESKELCVVHLLTADGQHIDVEAVCAERKMPKTVEAFRAWARAALWVNIKDLAGALGIDSLACGGREGTIDAIAKLVYGVSGVRMVSMGDPIEEELIALAAKFEAEQINESDTSEGKGKA